MAGRSADLVVQLDEPGTIFYAVMVNGTADCPPAAELFELKAPAGAQLPANATGSFQQLDYESATTQLAPLADGVAYRVCTIARDSTNYRNNQSEVSSVVFVTPDVTPPGLAVALAPGSDGGASCSRDTYLCNTTLAITLSEPGVVSLVLLANATLPTSDATAAQLLGVSAADLFPGARLAAANVTVAAGGSASLALFPNLDSQSAFTILAAAVDAAGNVNTTVAALAFTTPDVTPPAFLGAGPQLASALETNLTLAVNMSEPCTVKYMAQPAGAPAPTPAQLAAASNASNATLAVGSASIAAAGQPASLAITGLAKGTLYDVYLLASDAAGNQQPAVANISSARTIDDTPPTIANLSVTYKLPMTLVISAVVDKPGRLHYMAKRLPAERPGAIGDVLAGAGANFSGSSVVTEPGKVRLLALRWNLGHRLPAGKERPPAAVAGPCCQLARTAQCSHPAAGDDGQPLRHWWRGPGAVPGGSGQRGQLCRQGAQQQHHERVGPGRCCCLRQLLDTMTCSRPGLCNPRPMGL